MTCTEFQARPAPSVSISRHPKPASLPSLAGLIVGFSLCAVQPAWTHGDSHERIEALSEQLKQQPESAPLYLRRGQLHRQEGRWDAALKDFERAIELDSELDEAVLMRGLTLLDARSPTAAIAALDSFLARSPSHHVALLTRARAWASLGAGHAAASDFSRVLAQRPSADLYVERARALASMGAGYMDEALRGLDEGIAALGPNVVLIDVAVELELARGEPEKALERLAQRTGEAASPESEMRRGEILEQNGRVAEALAAYKQARQALAKRALVRRHTRAASELDNRLHAAFERLGVRD
ncbi:MAG: tetratricopeptide repeat protein [Burkholderiales bacterium]